jgi:hypothetical protein
MHGRNQTVEDGTAGCSLTKNLIREKSVTDLCRERHCICFPGIEENVRMGIFGFRNDFRIPATAYAYPECWVSKESEKNLDFELFNETVQKNSSQGN